MDKNQADKKKQLNALLRELAGQVRLGSDLPETAPTTQKASGASQPAATSLSLSRASLAAGKATKPPSTPPKSGKSASRFPGFFPQAEPLLETEDEESRPWLLRERLPLTGERIRSGARYPAPAADTKWIDLSLADMLGRGGSFADIPLRKVAAFDIECTGLSMGAGVYPFLVGLGYFEEDAFVVEQFFMEDLPDEGPMLEALTERLADFDAFLSFNGRAFDAPLLEAHCMMQGLAWPLRDKPHLDLLYPARRLWRGVFPSCSLGSLEKRVLDIERISDVAGALVPQIYLDFVQGRRQEQIIPVIDHNVQDIASTAALLPLFCRLFREPEGPLTAWPLSQLGLAEWFRRTGDEAESLRRVEQALFLCREPAEEHRLSMHLAREYRRRGRWQDALEIWQARATMSGVDALLTAQPCIELAKYFEHQQKDFPTALDWTRRALEPWKGSDTLRALAEEGIQEDFWGGDDASADEETRLLKALLHRQERLEKKKGKKGK